MIGLKFFLKILLLTAFYSPSYAIIGGTNVEPQDPVALSTVAIRKIIENSNETESRCTGTLISKRLVLTAVHCLFAKFENSPVISPYTLVISFGIIPQKTSNSENPLTRRISQISVHPGYEAGKNYDDIALVLLDQDAPEDFFPAPILDVAPYEDLLKKEITVAGFGVLDDFVFTEATQMRSAKINIYEILLNEKIIQTEQMDYKGACAKDSGGPQYIENQGEINVLLGVTRGGVGTHKCNRLGSMTYAGAFRTFIEKSADAFQVERPRFVKLAK